MVTKLVNALFGCTHSNYSFPRTVRSRRSEATRLTGTYVVCLDCGKEFPYDWQHMRLITSVDDEREYAATLATKEAA